MKSIWPFAGRATPRAAARLYRTAVAQSRRPEFYTICAVPDTVDGRFDMITLHIFLILGRLKQKPAKAKKVTKGLAQAVFDTMFSDMDQNLRELGVGDMGVGRRIKQMVSAFYGRLTAYENALAAPDRATALTRAVHRNLFPETPDETVNPSRMAAYLHREVENLAAQPIEGLIAGEVVFGPPPGLEPELEAGLESARTGRREGQDHERA